MTSAIGSANNIPFTPRAAPPAPQVKPAGTDSDGDKDGSKVGEIERNEPTSGSIGSVINTTA